MLAYQPAWRGGMLWDDAAHVTKPALRSLEGLGRIWFELEATQQYYPLLHSAFWVEHKLWGDSTLGCHLANIALHALTAVLLALVLRRLEIPGALLAAAIFALHPVHAESVAWITEQKNTLSAVFYLGAALAYLRFDRSRRAEAYALAAALFVMGLLSKTVTATLPAALLVVFYFKRGRLSWKRDVVPLIPFFVLGAASGLFTAHFERTRIGAEGAEFSFTLIERCLIAGRVVWFYLGKLFWPAKLTFFYPRWGVSQAVWWQYLFPLAALALLAALWAIRRRTRAPLAAMLLFVGTLFPVLGFFNVYPFRFSFVADHFQYLPSMGMIALFAAGFVVLFGRIRRCGRAAGLTLAAAMLAALGVLTWRQSSIYADVETLYRRTIAANNDAWLAHHNLGSYLVDRGELDEALRHYEECLRIKEDYFMAHANAAYVYMLKGLDELAIKHYRRAAELQGDYPEAHEKLARLLADKGNFDDAIYHGRQAVRLTPNSPQAHFNLACALDGAGRLDEAAWHYTQAVRLKGDFVEAYNNLATSLARQGRLQEAVAALREALRVDGSYVQGHFNLASILVMAGRPDRAAEHLREAIRLRADFPEAWMNLGAVLARQGRAGEAADCLRQALRLRSDYGEAAGRLAWLLATHPSFAGSDTAEPVKLAERACRLTARQHPGLLDALAAAYANDGQFDKAVETAREAIVLARSSGLTAFAEQITQRLRLYEAGRCYRHSGP